MNKFELPEIKVVEFSVNEVITTSTGYEQSATGSKLNWAGNILHDGGIDGDFPL